MSATELARRGTTNGNARGNSRDRLARRQYLVATYRADVDVSVSNWTHDNAGLPDVQRYNPRLDTCGYHREPACRCYRCGVLLSVATVTVDRIVPGRDGGTYRRTNIRPACGGCNSTTGGALARRPRKATA